MNTQADSSAELAPESNRVAPVEAITRHPFHWALKRELWEHKAIYWAPLGVAVVMLVGFVLSVARGLRVLTEISPQQQADMLSGMHVGIGMLMMGVTSIAACFYCLDALHGERRDRSILFWKSLPVSDLTTVLAKLAVPLAVVPVVTFVVSIATQLLILIISTIVLLGSGSNPLSLWVQLPFVQFTVLLAYALVVMSLWYAPLYAWLLLVSSWARRSTFLLAILPPLGIVLLEKIAFGTSYFSTLLSKHLFGGTAQTFLALKGNYAIATSGVHADVDFSAQMQRLLDHLQFMGEPSFWGGLVLAAAFVAGAVWMRRYREPL